VLSFKFVLSYFKVDSIYAADDALNDAEQVLLDALDPETRASRLFRRAAVEVVFKERDVQKARRLMHC
jgi:hypothetical protein